MYANTDPLPAIAVTELAALMRDPPAALQLIDVREPQEIEIAFIPGFAVFSLSQANQWTATIAEQLDPTAPTYVLCHHGVRSAQMCQWLRGQGFEKVINITGGIDAYSIKVDDRIPRY